MALANKTEVLEDLRAELQNGTRLTEAMRLVGNIHRVRIAAKEGTVFMKAGLHGRVNIAKVEALNEPPRKRSGAANEETSDGTLLRN